jgi:hypothetical protein
MKISESTITALQKIISGNPIDEGGAPLNSSTSLGLMTSTVKASLHVGSLWSPS